MRMAAVMRELAALRPGVRFDVRTPAPAGFFEAVSEGVTVYSAGIDAGAVESGDTLAIDAAATLARLRALLAEKKGIVEREAEFLRRSKVRAVVADIPFLAGDIAEAAGVVCIGAGNFTWDWIYEPLEETAPGFAALLPQLEESYRKFPVLLQMPFGQRERLEHFRRVEPVGLVATVSGRSRREVLGGDEHRRVVLVGMRGALAEETLEAAADSMAGDLIVHFNGKLAVHRENVRALDGAAVSFQDAMAAADVVISKLGYGIAAECAATGTDIVYPVRRGFREDAVLAPQLREHVRMAAMTDEEFAAGRWGEAMERLEGGGKRLDAGGARVCAEWIARIAGL
ncbi:MAG: hypothetical protein JNK48_18750 [Bryobacterales bacterium]|nr:hypothetical protein [Bryobacterales bacterium]